MYLNLTPQTAVRNFGQSITDFNVPALCSSAGSVYSGSAPYAHQILQTKAMRVMETRRLRQTTLDNNKIHYFSHDCGMLSSPAGSGKTLSLLLLMAAYPEVQDDVDERFFTTNESTCISGHIREVARHECCFHTLVVVPSGLLSQWKNAAKDLARLPDASVLVFSNFKQGEADVQLRQAAYATNNREEQGDMQQTHDNNKPCIIIMTHTAYHSFQKHSLFHTCVFQRVVIDEADSIHIGSFEWVHAHFTWLVTASSENIWDNASKTAGLRLSRMKRCVNFDKFWWHSVTVSCDKDYVDQHIVLPTAQRHTVYHRRVALHSALQAAMPTDAIDALEAGDVQGAIDAMKCQTVSTEEGLVASVTGRLTHDAREMEKQRKRLRKDMKDDDDQDPDVIRGRLNKIRDIGEKVESIRHKIDVIRVRVRDTDVCPITMDTIRTPATTPCCQNTFEMEALLRNICSRQACPMCRESLSSSDVVVRHVAGNLDQQQPQQTVKLGGSDKPFHDLWSALFHVMTSIFNERPDAKVLVFSKYNLESKVAETVNSALESRTGTNHTNVSTNERMPRGSCAVPKGNFNRVAKILDAFRHSLPNGHTSTSAASGAGTGTSTGANTSTGTSARTQVPVRVLLLNATYFGAGHNIECATHLITLHSMIDQLDHQIVGRAQRWGRTEPLKIIDIRRTNEEEGRA